MDQVPPSSPARSQAAQQARQLAQALDSLMSLRDELLRLHARLETARLIQRLRAPVGR